jgi:hypothetical protein
MRLVFVLLPAGLCMACAAPSGQGPYPGAGADLSASAAADSRAAGDVFPVPPPPFSEGVFPCEDCHANLDADPTPRTLEEHTQIDLHHGDRDRWCYDCHNPTDHNMLRLASGKLVPFTESYKLCGQCHGDKYRDWRLGIHGKRTGSWNGAKQYLLCASCHNPHSPHFKALKPLPPPRRPTEIQVHP